MAIYHPIRGTGTKPIRITRDMKPGDFVMLSNGLPLLITDERRLIDPFGTEYACEDECLMVDTNDVAGVGPFSLPNDEELTEAAKPHDFKYSSATYQAYHTQKEADDDLARHANLLITSWPKRQLFKVGWWLVRKSGLPERFWDNKLTKESKGIRGH